MNRFIASLLIALICASSAYAQRMYDGSGRQIGRVDGERYYDGSGHQIGRVDGASIYDGSGRQLGRIDGERVYNASGNQIGRIDGERLYSSSGPQMGRIDGERIYDGSGRQIGRADGLRRMQMIIYFYFLCNKKIFDCTPAHDTKQPASCWLFYARMVNISIRPTSQKNTNVLTTAADPAPRCSTKTCDPRH